MRQNERALLALTLVVASACRERAPPRARPPEASAASRTASSNPSPPDAAVAVAPAPADDPMAEKLRHCPVTVDGAAVELRDIDGGIEVIVTAGDAAATADIRRRAAHLVAFSLGQATGGKHGGGDGGGFMRNCPVVTRATQITSTAVPRGASLIVRPTDGSPVADLRAETRRRHDALIAP